MEIKNKKASMLTLNTIVILITILLFLLIFWYWKSTKYDPAQKEFLDINACKLSVQKASLAGQGVLTLKELRGCKTQEIKVDEIEPEIVHEVLAKSLYNCWVMYGQGKIHFLKTTMGNQLGLCFACAKIKFSNSVPEVSYSSLNRYIEEGDKDAGLYKLTKFNEIKEDEDLYVVFRASTAEKKILKGDYEYWEALYFGPLIEKFIGFAPKFSAAVLLGPRLEFDHQRICKYLYE